MNSEIKITGDQLQIVRVFDAPRSRVFAAWSNANLLQRWSGCKDATGVECTMDFRVGGSFIQKMHITGAGDCTITGTYDEIVEPEKISYRVNLGPATTRVTVEFVEQGVQTKMILMQEGFPDDFLSKVVSQGTMESFEKLDQMLLAQAA